MRLFQNVRLKYTWLYGDNDVDQMTIQDVDLATTVNFPNFLFSGQPVHISPAFVFHFWDGPDTVIPGTALPSRAYSTYLDVAWNPRLTPQLGAELNVAAGIYTDYDTITTDSFRLTGTGLLVLNLTPTVALKGGITYLDRLDIKILPAAGILWQPTPQVRYDIFFPRPKLARFLWTIGNTDVWWYLNGEYGGGSWTVNRGVPGDRRIDINDIRVGGGLEWTHPNGLMGFIEVAYVFEREIVFASGPINSQSLDDTFMLRGGLTY